VRKGRRFLDRQLQKWAIAQHGSTPMSFNRKKRSRASGAQLEELRVVSQSPGGNAALSAESQFQKSLLVSYSPHRSPGDYGIATVSRFRSVSAEWHS
jgi:hypothetical protein